MWWGTTEIKSKTIEKNNYFVVYPSFFSGSICWLLVWLVCLFWLFGCCGCLGVVVGCCFFVLFCSVVCFVLVFCVVFFFGGGFSFGNGDGEKLRCDLA